MVLHVVQQLLGRHHRWKTLCRHRHPHRSLHCSGRGHPLLLSVRQGFPEVDQAQFDHVLIHRRSGPHWRQVRHQLHCPPRQQLRPTRGRHPESLRSYHYHYPARLGREELLVESQLSLVATQRVVWTWGEKIEVVVHYSG
jgi:hypothetical protein